MAGWGVAGWGRCLGHAAVQGLTWWAGSGPVVGQAFSTAHACANHPMSQVTIAEMLGRGLPVRLACRKAWQLSCQQVQTAAKASLAWLDSAVRSSAMRSVREAAAAEPLSALHQGPSQARMWHALVTGKRSEVGHVV